jgi:hypothetical protein
MVGGSKVGQIDFFDIQSIVVLKLTLEDGSNVIISFRICINDRDDRGPNEMVVRAHFDDIFEAPRLLPS